MIARWNRAGVLILVLCCSSEVLSATAEIKGTVLESGYYQSVSAILREKNLSSPTGYTRTGGKVRLVKQTTEIPAIQGLLFGFKFRLSGYAKNVDQAWLRLVVKHPLIIRPNGSRAKEYSYPISLQVKNGMIEDKSGYKLDKKYEMVEGEWVFQYWDEEKVLVEQKFILRKATNKDRKLILATKKDIAKKIDQGLIVDDSKEKPKATPRLKMPGS